MNGRRAVVGLCMLCALLVSAFAAQGASASKGTTAFTCVNGGGAKDRVGAHCLAEGTPGFGHVAIAQDTTTPIEGTSANTKNNTTETSTTQLKMTIAGVATELKAATLSGEGWMENKVEPVANGEHYALAHGTITYTTVEVAKPAGLGCKVYTSNEDTTKGTEGLVHTTPLKGSTTQEGENVKIEPTTAGGAFAHFIIEGCKAPVEALNGPYTVSGSVTCPTVGATINCNHAEITTANTLKVNGSIKAGIEGSLTLKNSTSKTPLTATTVET
jgi:hypothetical protein